MQSQFISTFQTSEKRKVLLDEMAIRVQTKSTEATDLAKKLEEVLEEKDAVVKVSTFFAFLQHTNGPADKFCEISIITVIYNMNTFRSPA